MTGISCFGAAEAQVWHSKEGIEMKISVFGLGYVGVVSAACLARDGHMVCGVDPNPTKTDMLSRGHAPIIEPGLEQLIAEAVGNGRLRATADVDAAVDHGEVLLVCVGTPGHGNGSLDLGFVRRVCEQLGKALRNAPDFKVVVIRSTMLPGSMSSLVIPTLESESGKQAGRDFGVCINPEFLREGSAIFDYDNPPKTVIGTTSVAASDVVKAIYAHIEAPLLITDLPTAEMIKYADNSWHALKIVFANEIGRLCKAMKVDSRELMKVFCEDKKLNISTAYLRPGFAFGGSCLPKDVRAITYHGRSMDVDTPVLSAILASNRVHIDHGISMIIGANKRRIGILGLSFKERTDDLRESPVVTLAERLIGKGYELRIYDQNVKLASLVGANKDYILNHIPHISSLLVDRPEDVFTDSEVVVVATAEEQFKNLIDVHARRCQVIDLVGTVGRRSDTGSGEQSSYEGIAW
jgi:GDP-mannose 6-dehydrogenase